MIFRHVGRILFAVSILLGGLFFLFPQSIHAQGSGSLYFSPTSGRKSIGDTFAINLRVNTGDVAINAAEGSIVFDPSKVQVVSISKSGSIFSLWTTEPTFSNVEGTINFAGGLPNPGYSGSSGLVLSITLRAKGATAADTPTDIALVSGAILANDGEGTNIISSLGKASFDIASSNNIPISATPVPSYQPQVTEVSSSHTNTNLGVLRPTIQSTTHPDQNTWYNNNNPVLHWQLPSSVKEVRLGLSNKSNAQPHVSYVPAITEKTLSNVEDGVSYLAVQFATDNGLGPVAYYKLQIDTQGPKNLQLDPVASDDPTNPQPEIIFSATDELSGIDHYELKINDNDWLKLEKNLAGKPYKLPVQLPGNVALTLKAFDNAGNTDIASLTLAIKPIEKPTIAQVPPAKIKAGQSAIFKGQAKPGTKILIIITSPTKLEQSLISNTPTVKTLEVTPDASGNWTYDASQLPCGNYVVHIYGEDARGARSDTVKEAPLEISCGSFAKNLLKPLNVLGGLNQRVLAILFVIVLIALIIALWQLFRPRFTKLWRKMRSYELRIMPRNNNAVEYQQSAHKLQHLIDDIQDELKFLGSISHRRKLNPEEKYLKDKLDHYLSTISLIMTSTQTTPNVVKKIKGTRKKTVRRHGTA